MTQEPQPTTTVPIAPPAEAKQVEEHWEDAQPRSPPLTETMPDKSVALDSAAKHRDVIAQISDEKEPEMEEPGDSVSETAAKPTGNPYWKNLGF